jgi:hypothetical protein
MHPFLEPRYDGNDVVFNFGGRAIDDLVAFAEGYHWAGASLLNQLVSSQCLAEPEGYPILFLYRHALEVYLKAIVCQGARLARIISDEDFDTAKFLSRHELTPLLPLVTERCISSLSFSALSGVILALSSKPEVKFCVQRSVSQFSKGGIGISRYPN